MKDFDREKKVPLCPIERRKIIIDTRAWQPNNIM